MVRVPSVRFTEVSSQTKNREGTKRRGTAALCGARNPVVLGRWEQHLGWRYGRTVSSRSKGVTRWIETCFCYRIVPSTWGLGK